MLNLSLFILSQKMLAKITSSQKHRLDTPYRRGSRSHPLQLAMKNLHS